MKKNSVYKLKNLKVLSIALVDKPAIGIEFLALKRDSFHVCKNCEQIFTVESENCPYCGSSNTIIMKGGETMAEEKVLEQVEQKVDAVSQAESAPQEAPTQAAPQEAPVVEGAEVVELAKPSFGKLIEELDKIIDAAEGDIKKKLETFKGKLVSWAEEKYPYPEPKAEKVEQPSDTAEKVEKSGEPKEEFAAKAEETKADEKLAPKAGELEKVEKASQPEEVEKKKKKKEEEESDECEKPEILAEILRKVGIQELIAAVKELKEAYTTIQNQLVDMSKKVDESIQKSVETSQALELIRKQAVEIKKAEEFEKLPPSEKLRQVLSKSFNK